MSKRRIRLSGEIAQWSRNMGRKARSGALADSDERRQERRKARSLKRLDPAEFDELASGDGLE